MKKITYLLSWLFVLACTVASTATAQKYTYAVPDDSKLIDAAALRALTVETPMVMSTVGSNYPNWYDGKTGTYAGTTLITAENVMVWVPILEGGVATGKGYIKKQCDGTYLQSANITTFGEQSTAQVLYPVAPYTGGSGNQQFNKADIHQRFDKDNGGSEANLIRFVRGDANGTTWFNYNGKQYNTGIGIWTASEVRNASNMVEQSVEVTVKHVCNGVEIAAAVTGFWEIGSSCAAGTNRVGFTARDGQNLTVTRTTTEITVQYDYDAAALPFEPGTKKYNLFIMRDTKKRVTYNAESGQCDNAGTELSADEAAKFYFEGDNINGFTIRNMAAGATKVMGAEVTNKNKMTFSESNTDKFVLENNNGHMVFRNVTHELGYLNDVDDKLGYWVYGLAATDAGSTFTFEAAPSKTEDVTYEYYYQDESKLYTTQTGQAVDGDYTAPAVKYLKNVSQTVVDNGSGKTVKVICEQDNDQLPFRPADSFGPEVSWYFMDIHGNESGYKVYVDDDENVRVENCGSGTNHAYMQGTGYANEQWCFVGNVYDGFKIYNRAVGGEKSLYQPSDGDVEIVFEAAGQGFRLCETTSGLANSYAFKINGRSYYINHRQPKLQGWDKPDGGSSFRFFLMQTTVTLADDVQALLNTVNGRFPEKDAAATEVTWPDEYINGGYADFDFLKNAQQAVVDNNDNAALRAYKTKLNSFINLSNEHGYPVSVIYRYPSVENLYGTIYLPFNTRKPDGLTLYTCGAVDGTTLTLSDVTGDFGKNNAYIVKAEESVCGTVRQFIGYGNQKSETQGNAGSLLKGTHDGCEAPVGSYVLQRQSDVLGFYKVDGSRTINVPAAKCYLQLPDEGSVASISCLLFPGGTTTGIETITEGAEKQNVPVYDLAGRRVTKAAKGIYIIGGKKVVVK